MPPSEPKSWSSENGKLEWLLFCRIDGMSMQGIGVIEGKGINGGIFPAKKSM